MKDWERIAAALANGPLTGREITKATGLDCHRVASVLYSRKGSARWVKCRGRRWALVLVSEAKREG